MEFNEQDRLAIIYLFRLYFDDSEEKNPFDDEKELCVSHDIISVLTDIIIYCYNPILYYKYEEYTYYAAEELSKNKQLMSKLPESVKELIDKKIARCPILNTTTPLLCQKIISAAKQNYEYWKLRNENKLEWGACNINDILEEDRETRLYPEIHHMRFPNKFKVSENRPFKKENWIPVLIHKQESFIPECEYISQHNSDDWTEETIHIEYNPGHDRPITRETLNKPYISEEEWHPLHSEDIRPYFKDIVLLEQRAWVYYVKEKFHLFPPKSNIYNSVLVSITAHFPSIQGCTYFIERQPDDSPFRSFENGSACLFRRGIVNSNLNGLNTNEYLFDDSEEEIEEVVEEIVNEETESSFEEDTTNKIIVSKISLDTSQFLRNPYYDYVFRRFEIWNYEENKEYDNGWIKLRFINSDNKNKWLRYNLYGFIRKLGQSRIYNNAMLLEKILSLISVSTQPEDDSSTSCEYMLYNSAVLRTTTGYFDFIKFLNIYLFVFDGSSSVNELYRVNLFLHDLKEVKEELIPSKYKSTMPKDYVKLLITNALTKETSCPISMEPLTEHNASMISCFHVFELDSIKTLIEKSKNSCPVCRADIKWITEPIAV